MISLRFQLYPQKKLRPVSGQQPAEISIDNQRSTKYTIIQVILPDSFGLLYKITSCLLELNLNIVSARLATKIDLAVDTFYVLTRENEKIKENQAEIIRFLKTRLLAKV